MMQKIEIKNGIIVDGSGSDSYIGNVYLADRQIIAITRGEELSSDISIDATGKIVSPGFIDLHSHSDFSFLLDSSAQSKLRQGVTMELLGNCGFSLCAPLNKYTKEDFFSWISEYTDQFDITWSDFAGYIAASKKAGSTVNLAFQVGHGTLRAAVMGYEDKTPSAIELAQIKNLAGECLDAGALGLSTGLVYSPGTYSRTDELISVAEEVSKRNKLYSTHQRDEGNDSVGLYVSLNEAIEVGRRAGCKVQVSHVKCDSKAVWGTAEKYIDLLESANKEGLDIAGDQYPYNRWSTSLAGGLFPIWAQSGGREETLKRMADEDQRAVMIDDLNTLFDRRKGPQAVMIGRYSEDESFEGKNLVEIAEIMQANPAEAALRLYQNSDPVIIEDGIIDEDIEKFVKHPLIAVASDGNSVSKEGILSAGKPHPRFYGTNPRFIEKYVNQKKIVSIEEAVRKMTSLPAERIGLTRRGRLTPGFAADIVIMDLPNVKENSTFLDPHQYPSGITHVIVNGEIAIEDEKFTGTISGEMITDFNS